MSIETVFDGVGQPRSYTIATPPRAGSDLSPQPSKAAASAVANASLPPAAILNACCLETDAASAISLDGSAGRQNKRYAATRSGKAGVKDR